MTTTFNWKYVGFLLLAAFLMIAALGVHNYARADESYVIVNEEQEVIANITVGDQNVTYTLMQGDTVFVGEHWDISPVVPPYPQLAYWNGYDMYDSPPTYNITLPDNKAGYYHFYIDPNIFLTRLGKWYKYDGKFESNSNNLAFTVALIRKNQTLRFPNGTIINQSFYLQNETINKMLNPAPAILQEKHESDYLITTDEDFNITVNKTSALWLFNGADNSILYSAGDSRIVFNSTNISHLQPGEYSLIIQSIGNNTQGFDVLYTNHTIKWFNQRTFTIMELDTTTMVPEVAINTLKQIFPQTRDEYIIRRLSVQRPEVIISQMDELYSVSAKTYYHDVSRRGNVSVMDVRGYVNTLPGTNITVKLDAANTYIKDAKFTTFNTTAKGGYDGNWRQWQVNIPFYWDALSVGMHTISAQSMLGGGVAYKDFPITLMPDDSYSPQPTVKWASDRNPWVPTVTVTVPVPVPGPTQYITVIQTPDPEQINQSAIAAQRIVDAERWNANVNLAISVVLAIVGLVGLFFLGRYALSVYRRL